MKKKKLKKKELAVRIKRLVDQFSDLNNRLNRVSHDKLNQGLQLDQLSDANADLHRRLQEMQAQIGQLISQEEELSSLLASLQLQTPDETPAGEISPEQQETQGKLDDLNEQLVILHEQHQSFRHALEYDSQSADILANTTDDLRRDVADLLSHMRRLEESGSELLVSDSKHESQIQRLQNDITVLNQKLEQSQSERETSQQEVSRLLQKSAQPLQRDVESLKHQLSDNSGQHKALEHRLLELANRIGEIGARLESQQQNKVRKNEVFEQRLTNLESLVQDLQPVSNADASQLIALEQKLSQAEGDMASLLADKNRELASRIDSLDLRLSDHIDQQADLPDPLASITQLIEEQKEKFEETAEQLKQEISGLSEKLRMLDTDEHEAADWLSSFVANLDQQAAESAQLQEALANAKSDINRRVDEIKARVIITERQLKEQEEAAQDQLQRLANVAEEIAEQGRHGVDLKLAAANLQKDSSWLKESNIEFNERVETLQRTLQEGEEKQTQITQQLSEVEQEQKALRELSEIGMDSLQERIKTALTQLAEQSGLNEGLTQRLNDLESSLQAHFSDLDNRHHQILVTESENQERLTNQEQNTHALSTVISELKTDNQKLLEQSEKQKTFLEAMTSEYGKRQEELLQVTQRLDLLGAQLESTRSSGTYHGFALGGLFLLLLLSILLGYQYLSGKLGNVERGISLELMNVSENYLTKDEIDQRMSVAVARMESVYDPMAVEALIEQQNDLEQRLDEFERHQVAGNKQDQAVRTETPKTTNDNVITEQRPQQSKPLKTSNENVTSVQQLQQPKPPEDSWLALRKRGGYTVQLIGVANKDSIPVFAANLGLQGELAYITTEREGKAWHILIYGMYDSYAEATKALQKLPESLKSQQPWVRKMPNQGAISGL